jgi:hypothetical protein
MPSNLKEVDLIKRLSKDAEAHNVSRYLAMSKRKPVKKGAGKSEQNIHVKNSVIQCRMGSDHKGSTKQVVPQKVVIIRDSHARGCTTNTKCRLKNNYKVIGYV